MLMRTPHRWVRPKRLHPPGFVVPCQPTLAHRVPAGDGWIHELKHDGFRILAFKDGDTVRLWSRNGRDWSAEFVAITEAMRALPFKRVMLDGEAVAHCLGVCRTSTSS
jgi:bifunctional non-homologous end joining protein LigD